MQVHHKAPDFKLPDQDGRTVSLQDFRGKTVVLYFFPRADTPGWTVEASEFRDAHAKFTKAGAVVVAASPDPPAALKKFQEKYKLPFTLLSDTDKKLAQAYDVLQEKNMYGKKVLGIERSTFVIGPDGNLAREFRAVKAQGHAEVVLSALKQI